MKKNLSQRFYKYGLKVGLLPSGKKRSITDVAGIKVGHTTKIYGEDVRTGVTIVDPGILNLFRKKIPAAIYVANGYGKISGISQVEELGTLEAVIGLTSSRYVGEVMQGIGNITAQETKDLGPLDSINVVVADINDGRVNNIHKKSISEDDVLQAYDSRSTDFSIGNVGGGTGARAFSWKGGIGTASRIIKVGNKKYTLGILSQTNYGGSLTMLGVPVGEILGKNDFSNFLPSKPDGSCIIILATDAPLTARQLKRIAKRAIFGLVRTGAIVANTSGDYVIAFTTNRTGVEGSGITGKCLDDSNLNPFFLAAIEATEESIYDALFAAETIEGRDSTVLEAIPKDKVIEILKKNVTKRK